MGKFDCPMCEGTVNKRWFSHIKGKTAYFVAECWSGDLNKRDNRHVWLMKFRLPEGKEINQIEEIQKLYDKEWRLNQKQEQKIYKLEDKIEDLKEKFKKVK